MFKSIVNNIIPPNIKDISIIRDSLDIFLDHLVKHSNIAIDIYEMFDENKPVLFEEYVKIYLKNMYLVLTNSYYNELLNDKLKRLYSLAGVTKYTEVKFNQSILDILNKDAIFANKAYKTSKGTSNTIEYIYHKIEDLDIQQSVLETDGYFNLIEGPEIFKYTVEGSLLQEIFEHFVKPLAHPVGWAYSYNRLINFFFRDYFLVEPVYEFKEFYVGCQWGRSERKDDYINNTGFLPYSDDNDNNIKVDKNNKLVFPDSEGNYPEKNLQDASFLANGKEVKDVIRHGIRYKSIPGEYNRLVANTTVKEILRYKSGKDIITEIYFKTGEKLEAHTYPRSLKLYYYDSKDTPKNSKGKLARIKKDYDDNLGHCGLVLDYTFKLKTTLKDPVKFMFDFGMASTTGKLNAVGSTYVGRSGKVGARYVNNDVSVTYKIYARYNQELYHDIFTSGILNKSNLKYRTIEKILIYDKFLEVYFNREFLQPGDTVSIDSETKEIKSEAEVFKFVKPKRDSELKVEVLRGKVLIDSLYIKYTRPNVFTVQSQSTASNNIDNPEIEVIGSESGVGSFTHIPVHGSRTGVWVFYNPYYYNNTVNDIAVTDYGVVHNYIKTKTGYAYRDGKYLLQERLVGNSGLTVSDRFTIESTVHPVEAVNLEFSDNIVFYDQMGFEDERPYTNKWYVYGGYIAEYHEQSLTDDIIHQNYGAFFDYDDEFKIITKP